VRDALRDALQASAAPIPINCILCLAAKHFHAASHARYMHSSVHLVRKETAMRSAILVLGLLDVPISIAYASVLFFALYLNHSPLDPLAVIVLAGLCVVLGYILGGLSALDARRRRLPTWAKSFHRLTLAAIFVPLLGGITFLVGALSNFSGTKGGVATITSFIAYPLSLVPILTPLFALIYIARPTRQASALAQVPGREPPGRHSP
jgi:hypothetical protein